MHFPALPAPIIVQMGDAAIDTLSSPSCAPLSTFGGRIVVQMGDAAIDTLSNPSCAHYCTDGGRIVVQMGDAATLQSRGK